MADILDVQQALVTAVSAVIYPNGTPPAGSSAVGIPVKIYAGWPDPATLKADLAPTGSGSPPSGPPSALHVSVYGQPADKDTTRYPFVREEVTIPAATYTLAQTGQTVTVGGTAPNPYSQQNLAVFVNAKGYVVGATAGQTPAQLAAALQALIVADVAAVTVSGPVLTFPAGARIGALRVGVTGTVSKEVGRQEKRFQVSVWADTPARRSQVASLIDPVLRDTPRMTLADGSIARLRHEQTIDTDFDQKQGVWRRDLIFAVEWATVRITPAAQLIEQITETDDAFGDVISITQT